MKVTFQLLCFVLAFGVLTQASSQQLDAQEKTASQQEPQQVEAKPATMSIKGTWTIKSGERAGTEVDAERFPESISITKDRITIPTPGGNFVMSYKVVSDESPYQVDMTIEEGPGEGNSLGIMKMEDGTLSLCYDPTGENRPKAFETNEEDGFFMFTMKKAATKLDPAKVVGDWQCITGLKAGEEVPEDRMASTISFTKDGITIPVGPDMSFKMTYKINADESPAQIDMAMQGGPGGDANAVGIVKMEDGKFYLCYDSTGETRPEEFESTADNGFFMFEMEPVVD
jgi:uncharacterized protein (TIGR03067 family)